ncbi:hypothetical protein DL98DRAFT_533774 [Cadophora sp. DSE1049]|nr:hypothetical protein DL98DRAFT_533774 [Cadophora sp. DSE1049]
MARERSNSRDRRPGWGARDNDRRDNYSEGERCTDGSQGRYRTDSRRHLQSPRLESHYSGNRDDIDRSDSSSRRPGNRTYEYEDRQPPRERIHQEPTPIHQTSSRNTRKQEVQERREYPRSSSRERQFDPSRDPEPPRSRRRSRSPQSSIRHSLSSEDKYPQSSYRDQRSEYRYREDSRFERRNESPSKQCSTKSTEPLYSATTSGTRSPAFPSSQLFCKKLPPFVTQEDLVETFGQCNRYITASLAVDSHGIPKGFGFVTFNKPAAAEGAMIAKSNQLLRGKALCIQPAVGGRRNDRTGQTNKHGGQDSGFDQPGVFLPRTILTARNME